MQNKYRIAEHARHLIETADHCCQGLVEADGAITEQLSRFVRLAQDIEEADPDRGSDVVQRLEQIVSTVQDLAFDLRTYAESLDLDTEELQRLEERLDALHRLKRKFGPSLEDVLETADTIRRQLDSAENRPSKVSVSAS